MKKFSRFSISIIVLILHFASCELSRYEQKILDMKIKVITSIELASMSYDEIPALFPLYENFTKIRFEAKHKKDEDKEEEFKEFRKIHQFYALKNKFGVYTLFRDPIINERIDVKEIDMFKTNRNCTDDQITRYEFLTKDKEGNFVFHDSEFVDFFIAEYILDNIFKPIDSPSGDEMELRLRLLFHYTTDPYEQTPILDEFIMTMIEDLQGPIFSNQIQEVIENKFKYMFESYLSGNLGAVEKVSKMFRNDESILKILWGLNDNEPYFLRFLRFTSASDHINELTALAEKFFDRGQNNLTESKNLIKGETIFKGKNQRLNILYKIYRKTEKNYTDFILNLTETIIDPQHFTKLQQKTDFLDFVDSGNFSKAEKREFYLANGNDLIGNMRHGDDLRKFWSRLQKHFSMNELKGFLTEKEHNFNYTHLYLLPSSNEQSYVDAFFDLTRRYLSHDEIRDLLMHRLPISKESFITKYLRIVNNRKIFETCWNFVTEYLTHEEQKSLLLDNKDESSIFGKIVGNRAIFTFCMRILSDFYTKEDFIKELMKVDNENNTIIFWTINSNRGSTKRFDVADAIKEIFTGHEDKLKELMSARSNRGKTVFEQFNDTYEKKRLEPFVDLAKNFFNDDELKAIGISDSESAINIPDDFQVPIGPGIP